MSRILSPLNIVVTLAALVCLGIVLAHDRLHKMWLPAAGPAATAQQEKAVASPVAAFQEPARKPRRVYRQSELIHVCLASDDTDLRPAAVAIKSVWVSASEPHRLVFHYITTPDYAPFFKQLFDAHLPEIRIEVHHDAKLQSTIKSFITYRKDIGARKILASPFNFAPFYLDKFLVGAGWNDVKRAIYIDTDTLTIGDIAELWDMDLQGFPCAAVKYCLQHLDDYIKFDVLKDLGFQYFDPKQCIANRGVMVVDFVQWKRSKMTEKIEEWMVRFRKTNGDLWKGGMSQPPWLLAMNGDYLPLHDDWNCNSLGRSDMHPVEATTLRRAGFDHRALRTLRVTYHSNGAIAPYIVTCSGSAKVLHYNGAVKPWDVELFTDTLPACAIPRTLVERKIKWQWSKTVRVFCESQEFTSCAELWNYYITETAACALRDFDKEWTADEARWARNER